MELIISVVGLFVVKRYLLFANLSIMHERFVIVPASIFFRFSIMLLSSVGLLVSKSKNSCGVMPRYSQMKKKLAIDGNALPDSMLFI